MTVRPGSWRDTAANNVGNNCASPGIGTTPPLDKKKQKEVQFDKSLKKDPSKGLNAPFRFDILAQLANILARMTLYKLLHLSKKTRQMLRDVLANSKTFLTQVSATPTDDKGIPCPQCHLEQRQVPSITFTPRTCSTKIINMIDLYTTLGILVLHVSKRIQVDPGSALSIIPKRLLYFLGTPLSRLSTTTTTIYGLNTRSSYPLGKIRLRCQIGDLKSEVTCYIIDADMPYNLLLRWSWIHANWIVPSTLHQYFKYMGDDWNHLEGGE